MADEEVTETPEDNKPKGTLLAPSELTDWGNETRIVESGLKGEDGKSVRGKEVVDDDDETDNDDDEVIDELPEAIEETPANLLTDPGDYTPADYSFDVQVYDEDGKNGKTVKIKTVDQWDELLDSNANLGTGAAVGRALRQAGKMEANLERDEANWETAKAAYEAQVESTNNQSQSITNMSNEIAYLAGKGELPPVSAELENADWSDPNVAKQPGVKERLELLTYMRNENNARTKAGLAPMTSVLDAFNAFQLDQNRKQAVTDRRAAGEARKTAGAKVAGSAPNPAVLAPKGVAVGDPNAWERASRGDWST